MGFFVYISHHNVVVILMVHAANFCCCCRYCFYLLCIAEAGKLFVTRVVNFPIVVVGFAWRLFGGWPGNKLFMIFFYFLNISEILLGFGCFFGKCLWCNSIKQSKWPTERNLHVCLFHKPLTKLSEIWRETDWWWIFFRY